MFSSPFDGERAAAATLAHNFVENHGLTWIDVLHAEPPVPVVVQPTTQRYWRNCAEDVLFSHPGALNDWETNFLQDVLERGRALSDKQAIILRRVAQKTGVPEW